LIVAGEDAAGGASAGGVWAGRKPVVASRPTVARKAQRNMKYLWCCGIGAKSRKHHPMARYQATEKCPNRKSNASVLNSNLSKF